MMNSSNRNGPVKNEILMVPQQSVTTTQLIPPQYHSQNANILQPHLYQTQQPQHFQQQYYQTATIPTIPQQQQQTVQQISASNVTYNNSNMPQSQRPSTVQLPPIKDLLYTKSFTPSEQQQKQNTSAATNSTNTGSPLGNGVPPTPINNNNNNNYTTVARDTTINNNSAIQPITTVGLTNDVVNSFATTNTASNVAGPTTNTNINNTMAVPTFQDPQFLNRLVIEYNKLSTELNCLRSESKFENKSLPSLHQLTQQIPNSVDHSKNNNTNVMQNGQSPIINPILSTTNTHNIHGNPIELNNSGSYYIQKANSYPHSPLTPPMSLYSVQQHPIKQQQHHHSLLRTNDGNNTLYTAEALCSMIKDPKRKILKKRVYNKKKKSVRLIKCFHCGEVQTPEWRRGPYGNRTLCNACGLYYRKLIKRFDTKNANLIMRFNKLINPMDRRIPLNVNVPNNVIEKFNNDETLDSDYYSIKESI